MNLQFAPTKESGREAFFALLREGDNPNIMARIPGMFTVESEDDWAFGFVGALAHHLKMEESAITVLRQKNARNGGERRRWTPMCLIP